MDTLTDVYNNFCCTATQYQYVTLQHSQCYTLTMPSMWHVDVAHVPLLVFVIVYDVLQS